MAGSNSSDWLIELRATLTSREADYVILKDGERKALDDPEKLRALTTKTAAYSLLAVLSALKTTPAFADDAGLTPLHDLLFSLHSLTEGGDPPLLRRWAGKGTGKDGIDKAYIKKHCAVAIAALQACGLTNAAARAIVAREFSDAGLRGRKGGPLSPKTLFDWAQSCRERPEEQLQIDAAVKSWISDEVHPLSETAVVEWIRSIMQRPMLAAKI